MVDDITELYTWGKFLGKGSFGTVHEALHIRGKIRCAIKVVNKEKLSGNQIEFELM